MEFSRCPSSCGHTIQEINEGEERIFMIMIDPSVSINSVAQDLAIEEEKKKVKKSFEEIVPQTYHGFKSVFDKKSFDELPP